MKKSEVVRVLTELKDKRTHCQCSRDKIVEKAYFERVIATIKALSESTDLVKYLEADQNAVPIKSNDLRIRYTVYGYAIAIAKKYAE